jgi:hypothetical protein
MSSLDPVAAAQRFAFDVKCICMVQIGRGPLRDAHAHDARHMRKREKDLLSISIVKSMVE